MRPAARSRAHDDRARAVPVRVAPGAITTVAVTTPAGTEAGTPERVVEARTVILDRHALRPEVNHVGLDARVGVVEIADLLRDGAVERTRHRDLATPREDFRIVEAVAAGHEAALAVGLAGGRTGFIVERFGQDEEAGLL